MDDVLRNGGILGRMIETFGLRRVIGLEIKARSAPSAESARHLVWLRDRLGGGLLDVLDQVRGAAGEDSGVGAAATAPQPDASRFRILFHVLDADCCIRPQIAAVCIQNAVCDQTS